MNDMKKYEFTGDTRTVGNVELRKIRALRDFGDVKAGDLGGWIEKEANLSHEEECWVSCNAWVYGDSKINDN
jgi:hypothetical protein